MQMFPQLFSHLWAYINANMPEMILFVIGLFTKAFFDYNVLFFEQAFTQFRENT